MSPETATGGMVCLAILLLILLIRATLEWSWRATLGLAFFIILGIASILVGTAEILL